MKQKRFIDLFAGCGGLSLGLTNSGWQGVFAVEKTADAFETLKHNLIDRDIVSKFDWPAWLACGPTTTSELIENHSESLKNLKGTIDLIAGGPPCQGFSFAGRRNPDDPRNKLTEEYIQIVDMVKPKYLLLENVKGFKSAFKNTANASDKGKVYAEVVKEKLEAIGYKVFHQIVNASRFGVPQPRPRFIMIAIRNELLIDQSPFVILDELLPNYRKSKGLDSAKDTSVKEAISDLETEGATLIPSTDTEGFQQIQYAPESLTAYQKLMREKSIEFSAPDSLRLARHNNVTLARFKTVLNGHTKGKAVRKEALELMGTKKRSFTPLHPDLPSRTITTLPDDLLHYSEPRILTVRENARLQSFPDWFEFKGKYTTGGKRRKFECPRYTQVGNAVPPLMAEALGLVIDNLGHNND